jgi:geranylgeranyl diphosphate synthase type II
VRESAGPISIDAAFADAASAVQAALTGYLPPDVGPAARLGEAVRHSLGGGKFVRPMLVRMAAEAFGLPADDVTPTACAFELLHSATLVHDDLPAIDDAALRRGRPSAHVAFDEPTAILAGDSLIVAAFAALADQARVPSTPPALVAPVLAEFADAVQAVIAGELVDLLSEQATPDPDLLVFIHTHKTASLIRTAVRAGALLADAPADALPSVTAYGEALGLLFQITDDLLDVTGDAAALGKPAGADADAGKLTYPAVFGHDGAVARAHELSGKARAAAADLPAAPDLWLALVDMVLTRRT